MIKLTRASTGNSQCFERRRRRKVIASRLRSAGLRRVYLLRAGGVRIAGNVGVGRISRGEGSHDSYGGCKRSIHDCSIRDHGQV